MFCFVPGDTTNTLPSTPALPKNANAPAVLPPQQHPPSAATSQSQGSVASPAVPGVGPTTLPTSTAPSTTSNVQSAIPISQEPSGDFSSLLDHSKKSTTEASDVWYFIHGFHGTEQPALLPERETLLEKRPDRKEFIHVSFDADTTWTVWKNTHGQTTTIQNHLSTQHTRHWKDMVILRKLKGWENLGHTKASAGDMELDNQSLDVVDCPELREPTLHLQMEADG
ncbi:hypothetical protein B0H10DRAFT_1951255 [Mycena sp. CBHHK59/15]|nr:hypothetical protein B0H10DRAFT_1951255 [Mycena sp. CBHHK59/15]